MQAIIDSPVLKEWNYIGVTNDDIVLASRDVIGTDIKKIWTYYFPKNRVSNRTKELTYYRCSDKLYALNTIIVTNNTIIK